MGFAQTSRGKTIDSLGMILKPRMVPSLGLHPPCLGEEHYRRFFEGPIWFLVSKPPGFQVFRFSSFQVV